MKLFSTGIKSYLNKNMAPFFYLVFAAVVFCGMAPLFRGSLQAQESRPDMVWISGGIYKPFYPPSEKEKEIPLPPFYLDRYPVTQKEYRDFVRSHPAWKKGAPSKLFADEGYLKSWETSEGFKDPMRANLPVTEVSWFAANAYCESKGKRLPRESEWEFAALATESIADGRSDLIWRQRILSWYADPNRQVIREVGKNPKNFWGIFDLHGLIWEWVLDFNSNLVSSDNRGDGNGDKSRFCGAGSIAATDKDDYPTFMRMAFRSSLKANYTTKNLGFRCAADGQPSGLKEIQ